MCPLWHLCPELPGSGAVSYTHLTFIYVTHDQEEALSMSDTVVVMNNGEIQQIGSPTDIYLSLIHI